MNPTEVPTVAPVIRAAWVNRPADQVFEVFTEEIGAWWPLPSHGIFGEMSGGVCFRDQQLIEQSTDGREAIWGEVLAWEPPERLVIGWHPGRDSAQASRVEVSFESDGDGTRVVIEHRGWEVFGKDALERRLGYIGPNAWGYVLDHFADGAELRSDGPDLAGLDEAYEQFFAEADRGGFGPSQDGEWDAAQVVAHVALNDAAMVGVCQALVHEKSTRFENTICQDVDVLAAYIDAAGDFDELVARGRAMSRLVMGSVRRLNRDQLRAEVPRPKSKGLPLP